MVVQHNLTAMNANRQLGVVTSSQSKSTEKLSSGYRINRAGDDAAGLKISEKMRSQIRGLNKASTNAQDGVSLIQTAEGALNEAHSILQRMNELAVQGSNDTNEDIDRNAINQELNALVEELDRISETTQFNKQNLLNGDFEGKKLQVGANAGQKITISISSMNASAIGLRKFVAARQEAIMDNDMGLNTSTKKADFKTKVSYFNSVVAVASQALSGKVGVSATHKGDAFTIAGRTYYLTGSHTASGTIKTSLANLLKNDSAAWLKFTDSEAVTSFTTANVDTYAKANATIRSVQQAINSVSNQRSALGAIQNRLEHTIANLDNVAENTAAAESRIRDTDMASEMVEYSKNNILAQAGQSMLAQANQSSQGVLSLLQ